ncbi:Cytochrome c biogenesis protein CcsB [Microbacterium oleivorans]|uniref:cytochrome c biogenesis protein ResB n=1 Tax=Microbacterium oleivorans TaxID=273677 RepID=UPI00097547C2|nr:cytochrome c biogenesis protein ResB [Microbacterium oleivorans]AZS43036.1 Cytochrome c biogenesis protein CcsB [Microbacterium oleivorans]
MSRRSSEDSVSETVDGPLRPNDHLDQTGQTDQPGDAGGSASAFSGGQPVLGVVGWLRWGWRQLTSMRTALVLLLLLAIAAIPGSLVPQRSADPNGVTQWRATNPDLYPTFETLQLFDVYSSVWFSAIYILLFISLIGCVLPRTKHHWKALRARPPRTPARLSRLTDHRETTAGVPEGEDAAGHAAHAVDLAEAQLRSARYRVERYDRGGVASVSAERGYLRETGNLIFHGALVGVLISVGIGGGFTYTGQTVITEGDGFVNSLGLGYTSFNPGRFVDTEALTPYSISLDRFDVTYAKPGTPGSGQAGDFEAHVTTRFPGQEAEDQVIEVNHPITMAGDRVYLMGNGYAPTITVRNRAGTVVFSEAVPFLPQSPTMTSQGVVKVPDTGGKQLGLVGFFYPTVAKLPSGALTSAYGDLVDPRLTFFVYEGDLGINNGDARSVYALDTDGMTEIAGRNADTPSLELSPGQTVDLPGGRGTVTFEDETKNGAPESVKRYVSLSIHNDSSAPWVLFFAILSLLGLFTALFVPRRRMWVKATPDGDDVRIEYAGLARGEDPAIGVAVADLAERHGKALGDEPASAPATPANVN